MTSVRSILYKNKYWQGTKFGKLVNYHEITKFKSRANICSYMVYKWPIYSFILTSNNNFHIIINHYKSSTVINFEYLQLIFVVTVLKSRPWQLKFQRTNHFKMASGSIGSYTIYRIFLQEKSQWKCMWVVKLRKSMIQSNCPSLLSWT